MLLVPPFFPDHTPAGVLSVNLSKLNSSTSLDRPAFSLRVRVRAHDWPANLTSHSTLHVSKATQDGKATHDRKIHHAAIIAVNPDSKERFLALWSQLECFFGNNDKFGEVMISAPSWAKREGLIEPCLKNAKETLPHFKDGSISLSLQYYTNDRYDVGLWCDALLNEGDENLDGIKSQSILDRTSGSFCWSLMTPSWQ